MTACGIVQVRFSNNSAVLQGDDVYIYTLNYCRELKIQLNRSALERSEFSNTLKSAHELALTGTIANYLSFDGADTSCVKSVGQTYWLLSDCKLSTLQFLHK